MSEIEGQYYLVIVVEVVPQQGRRPPKTYWNQIVVDIGRSSVRSRRRRKRRCCMLAWKLHDVAVGPQVGLDAVAALMLQHGPSVMHQRGRGR